MISRSVKLSKSNSFFLFGARGTGKSTLLEGLFKPQTVTKFDLLDPQAEALYSMNPSVLSEQLKQIKSKSPEKKWVIIDEVQKVPSLLNLVHKLIEEKHFLFALTGSSARKLKRGQANLLAGRAFLNHLYPLTHVELGENFDLQEYLTWGGLPALLKFDSESKTEYLKSYTHTYLKEEVVAEQLVRNLTPFRSFLEVAAQSAGKIINFSAIARDVNCEIPTVRSYFEILEETYIGFLLNPFHESLRKRQRQNPKFYFFDLGVQRALASKLNLKVSESTYEYGDLFESFIILEIYRLNEYYKNDWKLSYLRTKENLEIDLIIDRPGLPRVFIEIKSSKKIENEKFQGFKELLKTQKSFEAYVFSRDEKEFIRDGITFLPWQKGFKEIGL